MDTSFAIFYAVVTFLGVVFYYLRRYVAGGVCSSTARLEGKTVIITGATAGIGKVAARDFASRGAKVIIGARNSEKAEAVTKEIIRVTGNLNVTHVQLDLTSLKSVLEFAEAVKAKNRKVDILVNNAGCFHQTERMTKDGFETVFQANYLGHFLLTLELLDLLKSSTPARIVSVASTVYRFMKKGINFDDIHFEKKFNHGVVYRQSKLAQIMFTRKLAGILAGTGVSAFSLHPGAVTTDIFNGSNFFYKYIAIPAFSVFGKSSEQGAQTTIHCAVTPGIEDLSGAYFTDCSPEPLLPHATDAAAADKLWDMSLDMIEQFRIKNRKQD